MLAIAAACLIAAIFLPMWKIDLIAPQYPEGLRLLIYPSKLDGDVEIINGLNHYIGMATLHTDDFVEFKVLPYVLAFFALAALIVAIWGRKRGAVILFWGFIAFSLFAMVDFYRWNYNYGHNLDPNAPIQVPGMAYQPPIFGFKQLLNFGAYSFPASGGLLYILSGVLMLIVVLRETGLLAKWLSRKPGKVAAATVLLMGMAACTAPGPKPVKLHTDTCAFCKMNISDLRFASQLITNKGRYYFFDDISCMAAFPKENPAAAEGQFYVADFCQPEVFIPVEEAILVKSEGFRSPMAGNIAGFSSTDSAAIYTAKYEANPIIWSTLLQ